MSDIPPGWAELLAAPLGPERPPDAPLAALPCFYGLDRGPSRPFLAFSLESLGEL